MEEDHQSIMMKNTKISNHDMIDEIRIACSLALDTEGGELGLNDSHSELPEEFV